MQGRTASNRTLMAMLGFLLSLIIIIVLIWRHYDRELQRIDRLKDNLKTKPY